MQILWLAQPGHLGKRQSEHVLHTPIVVSVWVGQRGQRVFLIVSTHLSRDNYSRLPITRTF